VHIVKEIFALFVVILALHALINIFPTDCWRVQQHLGVLARGRRLIIIGILVFVPDHHQSAKFVFTQKINNSGFAGGATGGGTCWFLVLPVGFLLTMYTITGYDASAHVAEETKARRRPLRRASGSPCALGGYRMVRPAGDPVRATNVDASTRASAPRSQCSRRPPWTRAGLRRSS
jgi:hypothetical protein